MENLGRSFTALAFGAILLLGASSARATTITVNSFADTLSTNGDCTFREAVRAANLDIAVDACPAGSSTDLIELPFGTITINSTLSITRPMTISGRGYVSTTLQFNNTGRGVTVASTSGSSINVVFQYLTMRDGGPNASTLANINFNYSRVIDGSAGIGIEPNASLSILRGEITDMYSPGGALQNYGTLIVRSSTIWGNYGEAAGAISNFGTLIVSDSTIGENEAFGQPWSALAGVYGASAILSAQGASTTITGTTIYHNHGANFAMGCGATNCAALVAGAVRAFGSPPPGGFFRVKSSVVANNDTGFRPVSNNDCAGTVTSQGWNLLGTVTAGQTCVRIATDLAPQNPQLLSGSSTGPVWLGDVGQVYLPATTSPLVNAIPVSDATCSAATRDQRGVKRGKGGGCEPGSAERASALLVVGNPAALAAGDTTTRTIMESLGFAVTVVDDAAVTAATANGIHLVVISESVTSTSVNTKLRNVASGVLVMEPSLFDDMTMTGATENTHFGSVANVQSIRMRPVTVARQTGIAGNFAGSLIVTNNNQTQGWGVPGAGAMVHATINESNSTRATIFSYAKGALLFDGTTAAPGPRVGFFAFPATVANFTVWAPNQDRDSGKGMLMQALVTAAND